MHNMTLSNNYLNSTQDCTIQYGCLIPASIALISYFFNKVIEQLFG